MIENNADTVVDVADIIGRKTFNTDQQNLFPRGLQFINGLKVTFDSATMHAEYQNKEYYVERKAYYLLYL